jgi:hypothetical protein
MSGTGNIGGPDPRAQSFSPGAGGSGGFGPSPPSDPFTSPAQKVTPPQAQQPIDYFTVPLTLVNTKQFYDLIAQNQSRFNIKDFVDSVAYQGFERTAYLFHAASVINASQMLRLAIIGAIRGANFDKIVKSSEKVDDDLKALVSSGVIKRKATGSKELTILRCTAALPQWAAFFLGRAGVQKKIPTLECHACLQFPAAASLPMSKQVRIEHIRFSMQFSKLIKGPFSENIYMAMVSNPIPLSEIPDELKLILGAYDPGFDTMAAITTMSKELVSTN